MNLVYAKKSTDPRVIEFNINDTIGEGINGAYIESDMAFINMNDMAEEIHFRINSEGGSVMEGVKIISSIFKSKIPVHTYNDGFAMSMGAYIFFAAKKENRHMASFASNMIHAARFVDDEGNVIKSDDVEDQTYLQVINTMLANISENVTGMAKAQVLKMMSKDTFLNAEQTRKAGLINKENIIEIKDMPQFKAEASIQEKMQSIAAFYNEKDNVNNNKMTDYKNVAAKLSLQPEASETAIVGAIDSIVAEKNSALNDLKDAQAVIKEQETKATEQTKKVTELEASVTDFKAKETELKKTMAKAEVEKAIKEGKFEASEKADLEAMAIENPEYFTKLVSKAKVSITVEGADIAAQLQGDNVSEIAAKYGLTVAQMNYGELWQNHSDVLARMKKDMPKFIEKLQKTWEE